MHLSAVVNTRNEERNIVRCLQHISPYVDEIVVVDMESSDNTVKLARKFTAKIWQHENTGYVEPARNFAIGKATGEWILLIDADEILPEALGLKLRRLAQHGVYSYYRIPRKNLLFGKWLSHSGWWPDYQIRLFKQGSVSWNDEIHSVPVTEGVGMDLPAEEKNALLHYNYATLEEYLTRLNRYTSQEAKQLVQDDYVFSWKNLVAKPGQEFLTRYFAWEGYKDGLHGLALAMLQAVSFAVVELKVWENTGFKDDVNAGQPDDVMKQLRKIKYQLNFWYFTKKAETSSGLTKTINKIRAKIS